MPLSLVTITLLYKHLPLSISKGGDESLMGPVIKGVKASLMRGKSKGGLAGGGGGGGGDSMQFDG